MKKLLTLGLLAALSVPAWALDWSQVENLVDNEASVVVSSTREGNKDDIINGNTNGQGWSAAPDAKSENDWVIINLGEPKTFTDIEIFWRDNHASKYSVYVSNDAIQYSEENWRDSETDPEKNLKRDLLIDLNSLTKFGEGSATLEAQACNETVTGEKATNSQYVLIFCDERNSHGTTYGVGILDIKIANIQGKDEVASLSVPQTEIINGRTAQITVTPLNIAGEPLDVTSVSNITLSCSVPEAVEITNGSEDGTFNVTGLQIGDYTITASAQYNDTEVTGSALLVVNVNWEEETNVAENKPVIYRWKVDGEDTGNKGENVTDKDNSTYYQYNGIWGGSEAYVIIDLGDQDYVIDAIEVFFTDADENKSGKFFLSFGNSEVELPSGDVSGKDNNNFNGWTSTPELTIKRNSYVGYVLSDEEKKAIRYIAYRDSDNPSGKPKIGQIYVAGTEMKEPSKATSVLMKLNSDPLFVSGEEVDFSYVVKDQYGADYDTELEPEISVTGNASIEDGKIITGQKGEFTITVSYPTLNLKEELKGNVIADQEDYCMEGAIVTNDTEAKNPQDAFDGGSDPSKNGNVFVISENEDKNVSHWILVKLARPHNLDMIILRWEGACPADYNVYLGETEDALTKCYSITGHTQDFWVDRFYGEPMNDVQFIKIESLANATDYGLKLFEIKAYGTPSKESIATTLTLDMDHNYVANDETVNLSGAVLDQFGGPLDGVITYYVNGEAIEGNSFVPETPGVVILTAKSGDLVSKEMKLQVVADKAIRLGNDAYTATYQGQDISLANGLAFEADENDEYSPLVLTFDNPIYFDLIRFDWESACPATLIVTAKYNFENEQELISYEERTYIKGANPDDRLIHSSYESLDTHGYDFIHRTNLHGITEMTIKPVDKDHVYNIWLRGLYLYGSEDEDSTAIENLGTLSGLVDVVNLQGVVLKRNVNAANAIENLPKGIYIIGGKKTVVR